MIYPMDKGSMSWKMGVSIRGPGNKEVGWRSRAGSPTTGLWSLSGRSRDAVLARAGVEAYWVRCGSYRWFRRW